MRHIIVGSLLLSPMLFTAAAVASQPVTVASASTQVPRISTGVIAPQILQAVNVQIPADAIDALIPHQAEVGLKLNVDANGKAQDIQVVKSANADLDARVVAAVRQFRFRPATLDNQVIPLTLDLNVEVKH
jgi:TonB family protein